MFFEALANQQTRGRGAEWRSVFLLLYVSITSVIITAFYLNFHDVVAGHCTQEDTDDLLEEEDGKNECKLLFGFFETSMLSDVAVF